MNEPTQICRGFTDEQWRALEKQLEGDSQEAWNIAIEVFRRRIEERYLNCIAALIAADSQLDVTVPPKASWDHPLPNDGGKQVVVPGFSIMALCCLLTETLLSFREKPKNLMKVQFKEFLKRPAFHGAFSDEIIATRFVDGIRNGILHEAETRGWMIWRDEPADSIVKKQGNGYVVNRNMFYQALKVEFEAYIQDLHSVSNGELRRRFLKKMSDLVKEC